MKKGMGASNAAGRRSAGVKELQSREGARPGTNDHDGAAVCTTVHVTAGRDLPVSAVDEGGAVACVGPRASSWDRWPGKNVSGTCVVAEAIQLDKCPGTVHRTVRPAQLGDR